MRINKKIIIYLLLAEIFFMILLPGGLLAIYSMFTKLPIPQTPQIFYPYKLTTPETILVYRTSYNVTETVPFEDYVKGVVSGEMPSSFQPEALKAQAVAARTYSLSKVLRSGDGGNPEAHPDAPLCDSVHCQVYRSIYDLEKLKGSDWMADGWIKICEAVDKTKGEMMYYNDELADQALFHSSSGGKTENSEDVFASAVPYLRSVDSPYENNATHQMENSTFTSDHFKALINSKFPQKTISLPIHTLTILSKSQGGRVEQIQVNTQTFTGRDLRDALNLPSANFNISYDGKNINIVSNGYGHGVGMSQYGANGMAERGFNYKEILKHYYTGVMIY